MELERVRAQLQRILASSAFASAERGSKFLRFVVETALDGRAGEIKEYVIGVDVLGRSPSSDPKTDPVVRVEAGRLRSRLNSFYQSEGKRDAVLISLPKGSYVPEFSEHHNLLDRGPPRKVLVYISLGGYAAASRPPENP
jgi:hypothetical protein